MILNCVIIYFSNKLTDTDYILATQSILSLLFVKNVLILDKNLVLKFILWTGTPASQCSKRGSDVTNSDENSTHCAAETGSARLTVNWMAG